MPVAGRDVALADDAVELGADVVTNSVEVLNIVLVVVESVSLRRELLILVELNDEET